MPLYCEEVRQSNPGHHFEGIDLWSGLLHFVRNDDCRAENRKSDASAGLSVDKSLTVKGNS